MTKVLLASDAHIGAVFHDSTWGLNDLPSIPVKRMLDGLRGKRLPASTKLHVAIFDSGMNSRVVQSYHDILSK